MLKNFAGDAVHTLEQGEKMATDGAKGKADLTSVVIAVGNASSVTTTRRPRRRSSITVAR